ncbi:MAG: peroxiredoxin [Bacteriovoracaceae bacterium]|jgi:alkyl hydroperoxide reductase subunit AhpC|nr:peroxiredoxin [Bacteriovoracaceae bacterium]
MSRLVGNPAPDFKADALMPDGSFKSLQLSDYSGKWLVLFFYPLDFTFVCPTEIAAYSDAYDKFKEVGCEVVACSVDSKFSHLAWTKQSRNDGGLGKMNIPVLADMNKTVAADYGVLIEEAGVALRGTFVIDPEGNIQHSTINNLSVGRNVEETLRYVEAYQYSAKHGEVCPMGWNKGDDTMKPDPSGSKEWFSKHN